MKFLENQDVMGYTEDVAARSEKTWGGRREGAGRKPRLSDGVSFTGELERADVEVLQQIAKERGVSVSTLVRAAVRAYAKRHGRK
jgi:hypothetical protein